MKIYLARQFFRNEDIEFNYNKIIKIYDKAFDDDCDLIVFPEMTITGFPIYEELLNKDFIKKSDSYVEKIVDYTKGKKTRILMGCPYLLNSYTTKDGVLKESKLFNSSILINDGYIDSITSKTLISKNNLFNEYKYFDKEIVLNSILSENDNFDVLIADDIMDTKNILYLKERKTDFIICLDTEILENIEKKKIQLVKIAKWTKKNVIYLNSLSYDFKNNYMFFGDIFIINKSGDIKYKDNLINENIVKFETKIFEGDISFENIKEKNVSINFINILTENYKNKNFVYEINKDENIDSIKKEKNLKLITFNKNKKSNEIEFIDVKKYLKNPELFNIDFKFKKMLIENIFVDHFYIYQNLN